jgi:hypothetical protein
VNVKALLLLLYSSKHTWYNDSKHQHFYISEWQVELVRVIGKTLNMSLHILYIAEQKATEKLEGFPVVFVGAIRSSYIQ